MDLKDPKFQKFALAGIVFLVLMYFWYSRIYSGQASQLEAKQREYQTMIVNLRNVEMKSKSLEGLRAEYEALLAKYREIEQLLPEVKMVPSFLVQLHTATSLTGTKILEITPKPIYSESFYNVAEYDIVLEGQYHDFGKFVSYIANFPFIVNMRNMNIEAAEPKKKNEKASKTFEVEEPTIKASFTLQTYYVKAEERLKELDIDI